MRPDAMPGIVATEGFFWRLTCAMLSIVWRGTPFCLWRVLERLAFTVSCGRPTHLRPDYSLAKRGLPRRRAFSKETQLDPALFALSIDDAPVDIQGIPGTINEKREELERITSKLEALNPHQAFVLLKNAFAIPKLQYVLRASPAYLCREELQIFDRALFGL